MTKQNSNRIKAALLDWGVIFVVALTINTFSPSYKFNFLGVEAELFRFFFCWLSTVILGAFKDLLFRNASLGKRIFGLQITICGKDQRPSVWMVILHNLINLVPVFFYINMYIIIKGDNVTYAEKWSKTEVRDMR